MTFEVAFGLLVGDVASPSGMRQETRSVPRVYSERHAHGFMITPSSRGQYEYYAMVHLPEAPSVIMGDRPQETDSGSVATVFKTPRRRARGVGFQGFYFNEGDPLGAYRAQLYINGKLAADLEYDVVEPDRL